MSTIDNKNLIYYIVGFNFTTSQPNLMGISLSTGQRVSVVQLPFAESAFVGVGQAVDVDPNTGDCIVMGEPPLGPPGAC